MPDYTWPAPEKRNLLGGRLQRLDGPVKVTGVAEYSLDVKRRGMLFARLLHCPHAHAKITRIDVTAAEAMPGVKAVKVIQDVGAEIKWALDEVAVVAADTEERAGDAVRAIEVDYEVLPHFVTERELEKAPESTPAQEAVEGDPDAALAAAPTRVKGDYGVSGIAHCCLEPHGSVSDWDDPENLTVWISTQNVSGIPGQISEQVGIPAANVRTICQHMGGGFGSKFSPDRWGIVCAELAKATHRPVKLFHERGPEVAVAGGRPSAYATVEVGAAKDGTVTAWSSRSWGSGGPSGSGSPPLPYVFTFENQRQRHVSVPANVGPSRAWRAPNHPQACLITMSALEDTAAELGMDPLDFFLKNIDKTGPRAQTYREELQKGAELIGWKESWHRRGEGQGPVRSGLGLSLHTWGGRGHQSNCDLVVFPDGLVEARLGSQDLGVGTRTVIAMVVADTFGIGVDSVKVSIGDSRYPASGASGGSTTVGGVTAATRRAAVDARDQLFERIAPHLDATPESLAARDGKVFVADDPSRSLTWAQAAARLGVTPITTAGKNPGPGKLTDSGVGGVQMADVSVDTETGIVKINRIVAVQDCGLVVNVRTAESQVYGALIMGVCYALTEEKIFDPTTGRLLNADMEFYKLAGITDVGELIVHMMTGPGYDERGVIGLGEPPVISPGAAISNAVANAIGVRVPELPLTADRVLAALEKGGRG
jgi:xanthine dehydrogenase YagR molybdenum-binding subunit